MISSSVNTTAVPASGERRGTMEGALPCRCLAEIPLDFPPFKLSKTPAGFSDNSFAVCRVKSPADIF